MQGLLKEYGIMVKRKIYGVCCVCLCWAMLFPACQTKTRVQDGAQHAVGNDFEQQKAEAARRGTLWLISQKDVIPHNFALVTFRKLYRVAADEQLRAALLNVLREKEAQVQPKDIVFDGTDERYLNWYVLRPVVVDLLNKKCAGEAYASEANKIVQLLKKHGKTILNEKMILSQRLVAAYLLCELGVADKRLYRQMVAEIRRQVRAMKNPPESRFFFNLYALTHIVFTSSGYYDRYLNKDAFALEITVFRKALRHYTAAPEMNPKIADLLSEILICYKLLGVEPGEPGKKMYRILLDQQNADGSWGNGEQTDSAKVHHTVVATLALMEFVPEFRGRDIHCMVTKR